MSLNNKRVIITGASQGLGFELAQYFVRSGAKVAICARSLEDLNAAKEKLLAMTSDPLAVYAATVDISNPSAVDIFVEQAIAQLGGLDIAIANAGIYGPKGLLEETNWDEWSKAIDINLKGTVYFCRSCLPTFKKQHRGKLIILSGGGATKPMPMLSAYAVSKAGVVRFAETLAEEVQTDGIDVNCIAPGALNTRLLDEVLAAGPEAVGEAMYQQSLKQQQSGGAGFEQALQLVHYLATDASDGLTGKLLSAVWDPWEDLQDYQEDLLNSDIYTLRRIVPSDRGKGWGDKKA